MGGKKTGLVVGKFAPFHLGHQLVVDTALQHTDAVFVLVYSNPDFPDMPSQARANWIRRLYLGKPVKVHVPQNPPPNQADDLTQREFVREWLEQNSIAYDNLVVFGSDGYIPGFAKHIGAGFQLVDPTRHMYPISGSQIRAYMEVLESSIGINEEAQFVYDEKALYDFSAVPEVVKEELRFWMQPVKKVVFLGAESTGKSTLTQRMAAEFATEFVAEYGREHYEKKGGVLDLSDYVAIAHEHRRREDRAVVEVAKKLGRFMPKDQYTLPRSKATGYLFVDTNALTTLFFSYYYNQGGLPELHQLAGECAGRYHHTFVCADDIPFEQDGWRDNEVWRGRMQGLVLHDLDSRGIHYTVVRGSVEERLEQVKQVLRGEWLESTTPTKQLGPRGS